MGCVSDDAQSVLSSNINEEYKELVTAAIFPPAAVAA